MAIQIGYNTVSRRLDFISQMCLAGFYAAKNDSQSIKFMK